MINTYDVKGNMSKGDTILYMLNWLNEAKMKGVELNDSFSVILRNVGELGANKIKQGKMDEEAIEQAEIYMTQFTGKNKDKYLSYPYENLKETAIDFLRSFDQAKNYQNERILASQPVMDAESYTKEFKKLGR